jgi:hypothetical protein
MGVLPRTGPLERSTHTTIGPLGSGAKSGMLVRFGALETVLVQSVGPIRESSPIPMMRRFTRLSLGFRKTLENSEAACAMFLAYYNFVWRPRNVNEGRTRLPAAMAGGVVRNLWTFEDLFDRVMGGQLAVAA